MLTIFCGIKENRPIAYAFWNKAKDYYILRVVLQERSQRQHWSYMGKTLSVLLLNCAQTANSTSRFISGKSHCLKVIISYLMFNTQRSWSLPLYQHCYLLASKAGRSMLAWNDTCNMLQVSLLKCFESNFFPVMKNIRSSIFTSVIIVRSGHIW